LRIALPTAAFLPGLGGAEVGLHNIARHLLSRGHAPTVIAPAPQVWQLRRERWSLPYPVLAFPPKAFRLLHAWPALGFKLLDGYFSYLQRRHRFDVWHVTFGYPTGVAVSHFARRHGIPHLVRCTGDDIQRVPEIGYGMRLDPLIDRSIRQWLPGVDALVAITESVADEYRQLGVPQDRIAMIPNGVDLARFTGPVDRAVMRQKLGVPRDALLFLAVGRNHVKKGYGTLLAAAARLRTANTGPDFRLVIAGAGVKALEVEAKRLGIADHVILIDYLGAASGQRVTLELPHADLVALYRSADVFVMPSLVETFGIVLVEAMAAGLPVVTCDSPGCRDVVRRDVDGVVVPAGDVDAFATAMEQLAKDPDRRRDLSMRALGRAAQFGWNAVVDQYIALYRQLVAQPRAMAGSRDG